MTLTAKNNITLQEATKTITLNYDIPAPTVSLSSNMADTGLLLGADSTNNIIKYSWTGTNATTITKTVTTNNALCGTF